MSISKNGIQSLTATSFILEAIRDYAKIARVNVTTKIAIELKSRADKRTDLLYVCSLRACSNLSKFSK